EEVAVDQEVLLLGAGGGGDHPGVFVSEELEDALCLCIEGLHGSEEGRLVVERLAGPRNERGRDTEGISVRVLVDVGRAGHVPGGVAARLEGRADAAGGEARGVRLALDQRVSGELCNRAAAAVRLEEAVVLLGGEARERVEDVGEMGGAL